MPLIRDLRNVPALKDSLLVEVEDVNESFKTTIGDLKLNITGGAPMLIASGRIYFTGTGYYIGNSFGVLGIRQDSYTKVEITLDDSSIKSQDLVIMTCGGQSNRFTSADAISNTNRFDITISDNVGFKGGDFYFCVYRPLG